MNKIAGLSVRCPYVGCNTSTGLLFGRDGQRLLEHVQLCGAQPFICPLCPTPTPPPSAISPIASDVSFSSSSSSSSSPISVAPLLYLRDRSAHMAAKHADVGKSSNVSSSSSTEWACPSWYVLCFSLPHLVGSV
jgi:hypothetical protein